MARIFDVIEVPNMGEDELVRRFPEHTSGDFRIGSQVIVGPGQEAVFVRSGKALDTFVSGTHTITTANIPLLANLVGKAFGNRTPFTAEVYFINTRVFPDMGWGTPNPIPVMHPGIGLGASLLKAYGTFKMKIANSKFFVEEVVGRRGSYSKEDIQDWLRSAVLTQFRDMVGTLKKSAFEIQALTSDISEMMISKTQDDFGAMGLVLVDFKVSEITPSAKSAQELRDMGLIDMQTYMQLQAADAMRDAANAPGGNLAGAGVGIGAGVSMGQMMGQMFQTGTQQPQQQQAPAAAPAAAGATVACPSCGHQNPAGGKFCGDCGTKLPEASAEQFCTQCGQEVAVGAKFCGNCGAKQA
jgi:membrane protease subunit (stomatin/prohibitin family)